MNKIPAMQKILMLIVCCLLSSLSGKCLTPSWAWQHNFNADITAIEYHNDYLYTVGSFAYGPFVFGNANISNNGGSDVLVMKWDTLGNLIWANSVWGNATESGVGIKVNNAGEVVVTGHTNSAQINVSGNLLNTNGSNDIFVAKYDLNGNHINSYVFGTAGNETAEDMCIDHLNNIYIASNTSVTKYSNAGSFVWQQNLPSARLNFSKFDSTIVVSGLFDYTLTVGNLSIMAENVLGLSDAYTLKLGLNNTAIWLVNISNTPRSEFRIHCYLHDQSGRIFNAVTRTSAAINEVFSIIEVSPSGVVSNPAMVYSSMSTRCYSISGKDSLLSFSLMEEYNGMSVANYIYNIHTYQLIRTYENIGTEGPLGFQCFRGLRTIYTLGFGFTDFGKLTGAVPAGSPTYQTVNRCVGANTVLTGNISGGEGALTYSWAPATGLNNTNTNTVSFTATNNITYTLTVTDQIGQVAKDTFNIVVFYAPPTVNITAEFPAICDSMKLYSNSNTVGQWRRKYGNTWINMFQNATDSLVKIFFPGEYNYTGYNACGSATDSIVVPGIVNVTGSVTDDTICAGQSIVFTGSGALNYTWTGGVTNNVAFIPNYQANAQWFIVTGTDANSCIGKDTVIVKVYQEVSSTSNISICANQTPYTWNAQSLDSTGTYSVNLVSVNGCDSIATLNLTVSPCIVCVPNFTINYSPFYNSLTESQTWIISSGSVLIEAGTNVKLDANTNSYVRLNPGFKVEHGAVFVAQAYNGCTAGAPQLPQQRTKANTDLFTSNEIVLYPNPTSGLIHINHDEKLSSIQIFDMVGKLVINQKCAGETETNIDLGNLPNGVYHVKALGYTSIKVVKNN
jgi:hypothetical protein